jgi:hypothetical protein
MTIYVLASVLIVLLVGASSLALMVGLLGEMGVVRLAPCPQCEHLVMSSGRAGQVSCPYCRHVHLAHPLRTLRHPVRELAHH